MYMGMPTGMPDTPSLDVHQHVVMQQQQQRNTSHTIPDCFLLCSGMHANLCGGLNSAIRISGHEFKWVATVQMHGRHVHDKASALSAGSLLSAYGKAKQTGYFLQSSRPVWLRQLARVQASGDLALQMQQHIQRVTLSPNPPILDTTGHSPGHEPDGMRQCSEAFNRSLQWRSAGRSGHCQPPHGPPQQAGLRGQHCCKQKLAARRGKLSANCPQNGCLVVHALRPNSHTGWLTQSNKLHPATDQWPAQTETGHSRPQVGSRVVRAATRSGVGGCQRAPCLAHPTGSP